MVEVYSWFAKPSAGRTGNVQVDCVGTADDVFWRGFGPVHLGGVGCDEKNGEKQLRFHFDPNDGYGGGKELRAGSFG